MKARVSSAYHSAADYYDHSANAFWDRFGRRTIERLGVRPAARVLDLCCGSGASALPAALAAGPTGRVVGVDLAPGLIDLATTKAHQRGLANIEFRVGDILEVKDAKEAFDAVVCVFGIFFVPDMAAALRAMRSYARPEGRVAVTTWGAGVFEPVNSAFWEAVRRVRPELFKSEVVVEPGSHPMQTGEDALALMMGTGYRSVVDQLSPFEWSRVREEVSAPVRAGTVKAIKADVIYATAAARTSRADS